MTPLVKRRVLCAEPHEDTCAFIHSLLTREGHEVRTAGTVRECLELAAREHFDLYMVDDDYVDGSNLELCKRLRTLNPQTPILFFSSDAFEEDRERAFAAGANSYLTKPAEIFEIVQTVNAVILSRAAGDAEHR